MQSRQCSSGVDEIEKIGHDCHDTISIVVDEWRLDDQFLDVGFVVNVDRAVRFGDHDRVDVGGEGPIVRRHEDEAVETSDELVGEQWTIIVLP